MALNVSEWDNWCYAICCRKLDHPSCRLRTRVDAQNVAYGTLLIAVLTLLVPCTMFIMTKDSDFVLLQEAESTARVN
jgi:hypothetical protein